VLHGRDQNPPVELRMSGSGDLPLPIVRAACWGGGLACVVGGDGGRPCLFGRRRMRCWDGGETRGGGGGDETLGFDGRRLGPCRPFFLVFLNRYFHLSVSMRVICIGVESEIK
jgi:hypothetical protein